MINGNELRPGMVTPTGHVLTLDELTVRHGEYIQAPSQPSGTWHVHPWPNGCPFPAAAARTYIDPRTEWRPTLERCLPDYSWPDEPSRESLERLLMAAPFSLRPSEFNADLSIGRVVRVLENVRTGDTSHASAPRRSVAMSLSQFGVALGMDPTRTFKSRAKSEWDLQPDGESGQRWTVQLDLMPPDFAKQIERHVTDRRKSKK